MNPSSLIKNRPFVERVWQRSKELEPIKLDREGKKLIKESKYIGCMSRSLPV